MIFNYGAIATILLTASAAIATEPPTSGPVIARADHVAINTLDQARSTAFYTQLFQLRDVSLPGSRSRWLRMQNGFEIHIQNGQPSLKSSKLAEHFAVAVDSLEPLISRLAMMGVPWGDASGKPNTIYTGRGDGLRQIYFQDPDGNWIEANEHSLQK